MKNYEALIESAIQARKRAYSPYSHFSVGAALLCADQSVFTGCNIENASYTPTCCAERVAVFKAVSEGKRDFKAIAIVGAGESEKGGPCYPCGVCRQVLSEFCDADFDIVLEDGSIVKLGALLPNAFKL